MRFLAPSPRIFPPLLFALGLAGCNPFSKARDCNRLVRLVNERLDTIEQRAAAKTPASYRAVAESYQRLAVEVRKSGLTTTGGQALSEEYASALDSVAPVVDAYAEALQSTNTQRIADARRALDRVKRQQQVASNHVDGFCRPH